MASNEHQNGPNGGEYPEVNEPGATVNAADTAKSKRSHRATGNPKGRPRKDGRPAGTSAPAAGGDQSGSKTEKTEVSPVLVKPTPPVVKKPAKGAKKKKSDPDQVAGQMAFFIQGVFGLVATRTGEHWRISDDEALNVALPAARILDRLEISETVSKYSDYAALGVATGAIIIPRVIADQQIKQARIQAPRGGVQLVRADKRGSDRQPEVNGNIEPIDRNDGPADLRKSSIADAIDQIIGG